MVPNVRTCSPSEVSTQATTFFLWTSRPQHRSWTTCTDDTSRRSWSTGELLRTDFRPRAPVKRGNNRGCHQSAGPDFCRSPAHQKGLRATRRPAPFSTSRVPPRRHGRFLDIWGAFGASLRVCRQRLGDQGRWTRTLGRSPCFGPGLDLLPAAPAVGDVPEPVPELPNALISEALHQPALGRVRQGHAQLLRPVAPRGEPDALGP